MSFAPGVLGTEAATLTVSDSPDPLGPYTVALSTGPTIPATVLPATLAFANVAQSATKTLSTLKVTNLSPFTLTLTQGISGANAADFGVAAWRHLRRQYRLRDPGDLYAQRRDSGERDAQRQHRSGSDQPAFDRAVGHRGDAGQADPARRRSHSEPSR